MIPSWARIGAKVVCVDAGPGLIETGDKLVEGGIYTLSAVSDEFSEPACQIAEHGYNWWEYTKLSRFRPLVTLETDMEAHFKRLLDVPQGVEA